MAWIDDINKSIGSYDENGNFVPGRLQGYYGDNGMYQGTLNGQESFQNAQVTLPDGTVVFLDPPPAPGQPQTFRIPDPNGDKSKWLAGTLDENGNISQMQLKEAEGGNIISHWVKDVGKNFVLPAVAAYFGVGALSSLTSAAGGLSAAETAAGYDALAGAGTATNAAGGMTAAEIAGLTSAELGGAGAGLTAFEAGTAGAGLGIEGALAGLGGMTDAEIAALTAEELGGAGAGLTAFEAATAGTAGLTAAEIAAKTAAEYGAETVAKDAFATTSGGLTAAQIAAKLASGLSDTSGATNLGGLLSSLLGAYGANKQTDAYERIADRSWAAGEPSRGRFEASMTPGWDVTSIPGFSGALDASTNAYLRGISAKRGNPAGIGGAQGETEAYVVNNTALPWVNNYQGLNLKAGGLDSLSSNAQRDAMNAIQSQGNIYGQIGSGISDLFGNTNNNNSTVNTMAELARMFPNLKFT